MGEGIQKLSYVGGGRKGINKNSHYFNCSFVVFLFFYFYKHNRPYKYCLNLKFTKAQNYYNGIRIISSNYIALKQCNYTTVLGKKWRQHKGSLSFSLIFLIWGFTLKRGRKANSWISTSHSSIVQLIIHFWLHPMGSDKGGGKERHEFAAFSHHMPTCEVVT